MHILTLHPVWVIWLGKIESCRINLLGYQHITSSEEIDEKLILFYAPFSTSALYSFYVPFFTKNMQLGLLILVCLSQDILIIIFLKLARRYILLDDIYKGIKYQAPSKTSPSKRTICVGCFTNIINSVK